MTETTTTSTGLADQQQHQQQQQQQQQQQLVAWPPLVPASFDKLDPSRNDQVFLYYEKDVKTTTDGSSNKNSNYRYKLTIIDRSIPILPTTTTTTTTTKHLAYATAVFLIPAGREAEYIFSSFHGLQNIAESASTARLVAVSFGRHHSFASQQAVQAELTFVVQILARQGSFLSKSSSSSSSSSSLSKQQLSTTLVTNDIPFMALDGIGRRNVIAEGTSAASGPYLVEQVKVDNNKQVRRLYFMNNPFVIQTEVFLLDNTDETSSSNMNNKNGPDLAHNDGVDKSRAAFDYHKIMAAGIMALSNCHHHHPPPPVQAAEAAAINNSDMPSALISSSSSSSSQQQQQQRGLLIGLGGGGLVSYMSHVWPSTCTLTAIELDPTMVDIATEYFGLLPDPKKNEANNRATLDGGNGVVTLDVRIGNGLDISVAGAVVPDNETNETTPAAANDGNTKSNAALVAAPASDLSFAPGSMSFIVIDVDSKDNSKGMSCPPQSFIEIDYLESLSQILMNETGVLAINVSARDPEMLQLVCRNVRQVFNTVILSSNKCTTSANKEESDDVNLVVFAKKSSQNDDDDDDDDDDNNILSNRNLLSDRLATLLQRNPKINDECISDLTSTIQDFSMWNKNDGGGKSSQGVKKTGGGGGAKKKPSKKKNKRGKKK